MIISIIGGVTLYILLVRLFGAWMFRITDVIKELRKIREILERERKSVEDVKSSQLDNVKLSSSLHPDSEEEINEPKTGGLGTVGTIVVLLIILFIIIIAIMSI